MHAENRLHTLPRGLTFAVSERLPLSCASIDSAILNSSSSVICADAVMDAS